MGSKITVDSASMFNKALEIIEAKWLFDVAPEQIQVLVHPQSVVHSMIGFEDGAVLAQLGVPDMRVPILYAMTYPERLNSGVPQPDFAALAQLTFEAPDPQRFPRSPPRPSSRTVSGWERYTGSYRKRWTVSARRMPAASKRSWRPTGRRAP